MVPTAFDPNTILTGAIDSLGTTLSGVAGPALSLGAGILALGFGWRLVRKFAK